MKDFCRTLGYITVVLGVIGSFILASALGVEVEFSYIGRMYSERNWLLTIVYFAAGIYATSISSAILLGIAEILEEIESLKSNLTQAPSHLSSILEEERTKNYWTCSKCGRANPPYTGTCGCGNPKG